MLAAVHLQVGEFEVTLVAPRIGTHEWPLLIGLRGAYDGRGDARHSADILAREEAYTLAHTSAQTR